MGLINRKIIDRGKVCDIFFETLSDGSKVYGNKIHAGAGDPEYFVILDAKTATEATEIFCFLNKKKIGV